MPFFNADAITFHYLDVGQGLPFVFQHARDIQHAIEHFLT